MAPGTLTYRVAGEKDVWSLMALYQRAGSTFTEDPLFLDYEKLVRAVVSNDAVWILSERGSEIQCVISILIDRPQGLAKISRMMLNPENRAIERDLRASLRNALEFLRTRESGVDVVYTTTLTLPRRLQEVTLSEGFEILGVFPNALGVDTSNLNGLTAYYFDGVLKKKRMADLAIHPMVRPFFELADKALGLGPVGTATPPAEPPSGPYEPTPPFELVRAAQLVERRFERLRAHQSMVINFYPFYKPNALVCNPDETAEVYCKIVDPLRFAAIIGEHLTSAVNPVALYEAASRILRGQNVSYIEVINDAGDVWGTECILRAGFTPCAYIPAFKRQGEHRRDYVVFGKSFEFLCRPELDIHPGYIEFFRAYLRLEKRNYFGADSSGLVAGLFG